ncbi:hypothetical protein HDU79_008859 [Rhizoclosmatium sp. JEL0117]|nr:hypothetical protein HDU79_008859 [Rhizoclosmatium sp. JEL0117]
MPTLTTTEPTRTTASHRKATRKSSSIAPLLNAHQRPPPLKQPLLEKSPDPMTTHKPQQPIMPSSPPFLQSIYTWFLSLAMSFLLNILRLGPVPKHVAFVMDGNRRFAKRKGVEVSRGHAEGADKLEETLDWCLKLGVKTVSVYAFSTENFARNKEKEVDPIMKLCTEKFEKFAANSDLVRKHGIAVRVHGRLNLLSQPVLKAASLATKMTVANTNATLNVLMPYTSREEIAYAIKTLVRGVEDGRLEVDDITEEVLEQCFWTGGLNARGKEEEEEGVMGGPLDICVRTSGEVRFSDFMLWQASSTCQIHFLKVYWPDFTFWHMLPALLQYQASYSYLKKERKRRQGDAGFVLNQGFMAQDGAASGCDEKLQLRVMRVKSFLDEVRKQRLNEAVAYA